MTADAPDPLAVLASLGQEVTGAPRQITSGWDNWLWRFTGPDGRDHALRLSRRSGQGAANEAAAMRHAREGGLPVPRIEVDASYEGAPLFIMQWRPGQPLLDRAEARPWDLWRLAYNFGRLQARLHTLTPPPEVRVLDDAWLETVTTSPDLRLAVKRAWAPTALCHLDFHPLNVLVRGFKVSGLVDFTNAAVTDPRIDLGFTKTALLAVPLPKTWKRPLLQLGRGTFARAWASGYRREAGDFPLSPEFEALGIEHYVGEVEQAVAAGRGWAKGEDLDGLRAYRAARFREAGLGG